MMSKPGNYAEAGVDRDQEESAVASILEMVAKTFPDGQIPDGHFAGSIKLGKYMISMANDGVGSKLILAQQMNKLDTIGIDAVAMCVNDLITIGSIPAAFVDYIAIKRPDNAILREIMKGLVEGCIQSEIPLIGGETATLPDVLTMIQNDNGFDVAGTALGIHDESDTISGDKISSGDKIIGIRSNGIHSNGLTLARKLVESDEDRLELLKPTRIYVQMIKSLLQMIRPHGMAHITGGGITNLLRLGKHHYNLDKIDYISPHRIFDRLQELGNITNNEMYRTFNCGLGFVVIVSPEDEIDTLEHLNEYFPAFTIGEVEEGDKVTVNLEETLEYHRS